MRHFLLVISNILTLPFFSTLLPPSLIPGGKEGWRAKEERKKEEVEERNKRYPLQ